MTVLKGGTAPLQRVTLAIDASEPSAKAVAFVLRKFHLGRSTGEGQRAPIHVSVVHVMACQRLAPLTIRMTVPWIKSEQKVKDAAYRLVEQCAEELIKAGFTADPICKTGNPAEEIMKVAVKQRADLIVIGAKGLGAVDRMLLGSVSMQVLQYANCPVLVVR